MFAHDSYLMTDCQAQNKLSYGGRTGIPGVIQHPCHPYVYIR
jgi:hypothetical protein